MEAVRKMKSRACTTLSLLACCLSAAPALFAQTPPATQLFGPVNVRLSQDGAGFGTSAVTFNSTTVSLSCSDSPMAMLSGTADGTGPVLVDNLIQVTNLSSNNGPADVCSGGQTDTNNNISYPDCFTVNYQAPAGNSQLTGADMDTYNNTLTVNGTSYLVNLNTGGVGPLDISNFLVADKPQQLEIDLQDEGGYVASSSVYLVTNCTVGGVQGNGAITGNPISSSSPTDDQLNQDFDFDTTTNQVIGFVYDLRGAKSDNTLTITDQTIPQVNDTALTQAAYQTLMQGTSFATSNCLIHSGELSGDTPVCKLFTLTCLVGTGNTGTGAQCPVSSKSNEVLQDQFDGPSFMLPSITTPAGKTFHQGMAFLMASEAWNGGFCQFISNEQNDPLTSALCPLNILVSFSGPGGYIGSSQTTHPNSQFIMGAQVPEDLTSVTATDNNGNPLTLGQNNWTNNPDPFIVLSSQPPNFTGMTEQTLPGVTHFVAAPIQSITWGITSGPTPPTPGSATGQTAVDNAIPCPTSGDPTGTPATTFTTAPQELGVPDGSYLVNYFATDCAGTEELQYENTAQDDSGSWSTNYYTYPINIDRVKPQVSGPTFSPAGPYTPGERIMATFDCTDDRSGVVSCGGQSFPVGTLDTGSITVPVTVSSSGSFSVTAIDAAGNQYTASSSYTDSQIVLTEATGTVTYPLGTNLQVQVNNINGHVPTGTVQILDNGSVVTTLTLNKSGAAPYYIKNLPAGMHSLTAVYSGDKYNSPGISTSVTLNVLPVPVTMSLACWNSPFPYGANFQCVVSTSSNAGAPLGHITYAIDANPPQNLNLSSGSATVVDPKPIVGSHSIVISYPAQTNYAAAGPQTVNFVVTPAPVVLKLTPSAWSVTGGTLTLTATVQSSSAGAPNQIGGVTFNVPGIAPITVPVNSSGVAVDSGIPVSSITNGTDSISATYSGTNYATTTTTISVQVNHH